MQALQETLRDYSFMENKIEWWEIDPQEWTKELRRLCNIITAEARDLVDRTLLLSEKYE